MVRAWLGKVGVKTLFIEPGSPRENGYVESFNGKLRDELLNQESFETVRLICRDEGLKVPPIKPKRRVPGHGPKPGLVASGKDDVWALDFAHDRTEDGRPLKILAVVDEYTRECPALIVDRRMRSGGVIETLRELFLVRGVPRHVRSDNGPELIATRLKTWLEGFGVDHEYIEPGKPWQNGHIESFNGRLRVELLAGELLPALTEARWLLERWQLDYNHRRPHSALGYTTPAAYAAGLESVCVSAPGDGPPGGLARLLLSTPLRSVLSNSQSEERLSCHSGWTTKWRPVTTAMEQCQAYILEIFMESNWNGDPKRIC